MIADVLRRISRYLSTWGLSPCCQHSTYKNADGHRYCAWCKKKIVHAKDVFNKFIKNSVSE